MLEAALVRARPERTELWLDQVCPDGLVIANTELMRFRGNPPEFLWATELADPIGLVHSDGRIRSARSRIGLGYSWSVVDLRDGRVIRDRLLAEQLTLQGLWKMNGRRIGRTDLASGRDLWELNLDEALGDVVTVLGDGLVLCEREVLRVNAETGAKMWRTRGLASVVGTLRHLDADGRVSGRDGIPQAYTRPEFAGKLKFGVARIDVERGRVLFTSRDLSETDKQALRDLGVSRHERFYDAAFVRHIVERRHSPTSARVRRAVGVIYPREDLSRAFQINNLDDFMRAYDVYYYEAGTEQELYDALDEIARLPRLEVLILGGHGVQQRMSLGGGDPATGEPVQDEQGIDLADRDELARYEGAFRGTTIVLDACFTGLGKERGDNIANMLRSTLARGATLYAPTNIISSSFLFDQAGNFIGPAFHRGDDLDEGYLVHP